VLADYRARKINVVCNAMLWTEGFDDPQTSCIALARPTGSPALVAQMIGRGTRLAEGKGSCLVIDFTPGRAAKLRLASAAAALAGEVLEPEPKVTKKQKAERLERERILAALERRRWIAEVGVVYAAPALDVDELLAALGAGRAAGPCATERQVSALQKAGFAVDSSLSRQQADKLFGVVHDRRERGLCTIKQARSLRRLGFPDDMTMQQASYVLDKMAAVGWRMSAQGREALASAMLAEPSSAGGRRRSQSTGC
jgi:superfamily II DNA or RNA helicase